MHPTRLDFYASKLIGELKRFVSCMLTSKLHEDMPIGLPCIGWIDPFQLSSAAIDSYYDVLPKDLFERTTTPDELFSAGLTSYAVTDIVHTCVNKLQIINLFPTSAVSKGEYLPQQISGKGITILPIKPIIYDEGTVINFAKIRDIFDEVDDSPSKFPSYLAATLKNTRYVTYIVNSLNRNNTKEANESCFKLFNALRQHLPESVLITQPNLSSVRSLYDTIAISFYRMDDVIAVFDRSKAGVAMEIYLTNAVWDPYEMVEKSAVFRFLFSKSRENLFTIDGEPIRRQLDAPVNDAKEMLDWIFTKHLPVSLEEPKNKGKERKTQKEVITAC